LDEAFSLPAINCTLAKGGDKGGWNSVVSTLRHGCDTASDWDGPQGPCYSCGYFNFGGSIM